MLQLPLKPEAGAEPPDIDLAILMPDLAKQRGRSGQERFNGLCRLPHVQQQASQHDQCFASQICPAVLRGQANKQLQLLLPLRSIRALLSERETSRERLTPAAGCFQTLSDTRQPGHNAGSLLRRHDVVGRRRQENADLESLRRRQVPVTNLCRRCLRDTGGLARIEVREVWEVEPAEYSVEDVFLRLTEAARG